jgi:SEC-C motif-containing protein
MNTCFCCSQKSFESCCKPYLDGTQHAPTAEALMRSRYSAYVLHEVDYLMTTTHPSQLKFHSKEETLRWSVSNQWLKLEIINATSHIVEFKAYFIGTTLKNQIHHERSTFRFENNRWLYVDGVFF